jgi:hypothetical protein
MRPLSVCPGPAVDHAFGRSARIHAALRALQQRDPISTKRAGENLRAGDPNLRPGNGPVRI